MPSPPTDGSEGVDSEFKVRQADHYRTRTQHRGTRTRTRNDLNGFDKLPKLPEDESSTSTVALSTSTKNAAYGIA
jgi:hypothetical protein